LRVGVVGVGTISAQYLDSFRRLPGLRLVAVADLDGGRAKQVAQLHGVEPLTVDALLADARVDAVLNLTTPAAHVEIDLRALENRKHVFAEKPFALTPAEGSAVLALAAEQGLRVGSAPDTFLGTGVQTSIRVLDSGTIGSPVGATAFWAAPGHELWHPAPQFYYDLGGGPVFDMGPYYLTALVSILGPVVRVSAGAGRSDRKRVIATGPHTGTPVEVHVDTHITAVVEHASGVASSVTVSFEGWATRIPHIEIYGTEGVLAVPDPNRFSDPVSVWTPGAGEWRDVPPGAGYVDAGRGYGLADMARAIETDRPHRASGELALHVLEIMDAMVRSAHEHRMIAIASTVARPAPVRLGTAPDTW
jgi:predicted dehydrogenase